MYVYVLYGLKGGVCECECVFMRVYGDVCERRLQVLVLAGRID